MLAGLHNSVFLVGATASGKSAVALALAEQLGGEIISVDSMQVYRGLDIGTAKPTPAERERVSHHGIDIAEPDEAFDVGQFVRIAADAAEQVFRRGRPAIYCGGSGLYFNALLGGLGTAPPSDPRLRTELESLPLPDLLAELAERDPTTFARIDRRNPRRVVRAVEVVRLTGQPASVQRAAWQAIPPEAWCVGLVRTAADLRQRMESRVDAMFRAGLVEETRGLLERGLAGNRTAAQALGYRQIIEHLQGERNLAATQALVKQKTRQYAKRQMTWFRRQLPVDWISLEPDGDVASVASRIAGRYRARTSGRI